MEDSLERMGEKFTEIAENFRVFGPVIQEHAAIRNDLEHLVEDVRAMQVDTKESLARCADGIETVKSSFQELEKVRLQREEQDREREEAKAASDKRDRWARVSIAGSLFLVFIGMTINWILLLLGVGQ